MSASPRSVGPPGTPDTAAPAPRHRERDESRRYGLGLSGQFRSHSCSGHGVDSASRGTAAKQLSWIRPSDNGMPMTNLATSSLLDRANLDRDAARHEVARGLAG